MNFYRVGNEVLYIVGNVFCYVVDEKIVDDKIKLFNTQTKETFFASVSYLKKVGHSEMAAKVFS